jgi:hypothetical protein
MQALRIGVAALEQRQHAACGELGAAGGQRHLQRVEHPSRGGAVARQDRLALGGVQDAVAAQQLEERGAIGLERGRKALEAVAQSFHYEARA